MAGTAKAAGSGTKWRGLSGLPALAAVLWGCAIVGAAWIIDTYADEPPGPWLVENLGTVVEVVPAVVIAIFVFAVGTLFVVAQVVPPTRGTRAVEILRGRHLSWTLSPALALTPLSTLVLVLDPERAWPLASALLIGAAVYLLASSWFLLRILGEATDPVHYSQLLRGLHNSAMRGLRPFSSDPTAAESANESKDRRGALRRAQASAWGRLRWRTRQRAVNAQYDMIRTLRGWTRTAATSGDSRELHVALETTLALIDDYAQIPPDQRPTKVPRNYAHNADDWRTNPLDREQPVENGDEDSEELQEWTIWVPPAWPGTGDAEAHKALARVWVASEVGRSLVRALEFASTSKALLDRDRGRLLQSLEKAARRFGEGDSDSAGVIVAYLIELGLGVRRCPPEDLSWHFEPLISLARLHQRFHDPGRRDPREESDVPTRNRELAVGTAAGVLKVAEAITAVRVRQHYEQSLNHVWAGEINPRNDDIGTICRRTIAELNGVRDMKEFKLFFGPVNGSPARSQPKSRVPRGDRLRTSGLLLRLIRLRCREPGSSVTNPALEDETSVAATLAKSTVLEPRDQPAIHMTDPGLVNELNDLLRPEN